jgi:hypothetical protein
MRKPPSEIGALGQEQGEVVEAGVPVSRLRPGFLYKNEQLALAGPERGRLFVSREDRQPDRAIVVLK